MLSDAIPQLSLLLASMSPDVIDTFPVASNCTVMSCAAAVGATTSTTVTIANPVLTLPFTSVTVSVTAFTPTSLQLKLFGSTLVDATPHASLLPASTPDPSAGIATLPFASSCTVMFCVRTTGGTLSCTVTTAVAVLTFPLLSVTVSVTVLAPTFAQLKSDGATLSDAIPQASLLPLST